MNQSLCRGLAATVLLCTAGIPLSANAEELNEEAMMRSQKTYEISHPQPDTLESEPILQDHNPVLSETETEIAGASSPLSEGMTAPEPVNPEISRQQSDLSETEAILHDEDPTHSEVAAQPVQLSNLFDVSERTIEGESVAVLSVDSLPMLIFAAQPPDSSAEKSDVEAGDQLDPLTRAEQTAQQIDQFHQASGNPDTIGVRWDEETEEYTVSLDDETLVVINEATRYFNSSGDLAADALQATNRLRALLGADEPLTEIEGQPEPEPTAQSNWGVTSVFSGQASWYGPGFHGRHTASGEVFNQNALTAAHRTLPFGTLVRVTNVNNNRQVVVRVNDRGPFSHGRVIDLSAGAARAIGLDRAGVGPVRVEVLSE